MATPRELLELAGYPEDFQTWASVAFRLEQMELYAKAAEACAIGLQSGPNSSLQALLVRNLQRIGFAHEALRHLYDLHTREPEFPGIHEWLVESSLEAGRPDVTVQFLTDPDTTLRWLESRLGNPALRFGYAFLLYHGQRFEEAIVHFRLLESVRDWSIWAHSMTGLCYYRLGELYPSVDHFQRGLGLVDPDARFEYRELYFNKACVLFVHGKLRETLHSLEQLLRIDPHYPEAAEWAVEVRELLRNGGDGPGRLARRIPRTPPPFLKSARRWGK